VLPACSARRRMAYCRSSLPCRYTVAARVVEYPIRSISSRSQVRSGETALDSFEALAELVQLGALGCGRGLAGLGESRGC
jgi:hypothetical protein